MAADPRTPASAGALAQPEPWVAAASYAQERVWLASQVARDVPVYHVLDFVRFHSALPERRVLDAILEVVARHETLRTAFRIVDGELAQVVHPEPVDVTQTVDLRGVEEDEQHGRMLAVQTESLYQPFDLERAPLWRTTLFRLADDAWGLLVIAHHSVYDAASVFNLQAELTEICAAAEQGRQPDLPELTIQYADFAAWQRGRLSGPELDGLLDYWRTKLAGLPPVHSLPTDRPRPAERTFAGSEIRVPLPREVTATLPQAARRHNATPFMVLLAAYGAVLHRRSGQDDIVVGVPVAGRDRPDLLPLIGMFVNMVVLRTDASGDPTFAGLVERVRATALAAWDHQEMPYQKLVEALVAVREPGVPPLYQLGFNLVTTPGFGGGSTTAEDDLMLEVNPDTVRVEYNTALFDRGTVQGLLEDFLRVLTAGLADPATPLSRLPVRDAAVAPTAPATAPPPVRQARAEHVPARTAAEELVAEAWAEVLGLERVGAFDDFFDLGGHSLLALRVIARLSAACGVEVPIQAFFTDTTVAGVASEIEQLLAAELEEMSEEEALRLVREGEG